MSQKYKIANHLVIRECDLALFDSRKFQILKFNPTGFELIKILHKESHEHDELKKIAQNHNISNEDFSYFLNKCIEQGIIVQHD